MALAFQTAQINAVTGQTTIPLTKPTGTASNDLLIAHIRSNGLSITGVPTGWTTVVAGSVYSKIATASEPTSYTWTQSGTNDLVGIISRISGEDLSNVINANGTAVNVGVIATATLTGGITPTLANSLLFSCIEWDNSARSLTSFAIANSNPTWATAASAAQSNTLIQDMYGAFAPATTTGNAVATLSGTVNGGQLRFYLLAITVAQPVTISPTIFGATFGLFAPVMAMQVKAVLFGATFGILGPVITTIGKWKNQAKHAASWLNLPKD